MSDVIHHGGGLLAAQRAFPDAPKPWLDLSTGINPVAYPFGDIPPAVWARLPEAEEAAALETVAAKTYGAPEPACVVASPGVQILIQLLPLLFGAKTVAILAPTYDEHAHRWRVSGADVTTAATLDDMRGADVAVVVNPNNPDGRIVAPNALDALASDGKLLIVDESFADVLPRDASFVSHVATRRVIVLRSLGKFFGLAGLRLGFAIAPPGIAARLSEHLGPWAVSGPAITIGCRALADVHWQDSSRARLAKNADRLDALLKTAGFDIIGGTTLFRLARHPEASAYWAALCGQGILTRAFADRPELLRFGLPGEESAWQRLETGTTLLK